MGNGLIDGEQDNFSKNERIKKQSDFLRGKIIEQLDNEKDKFTKPMTELLKFHGIYQESNRDKENLEDASHNPTIFMIRSRIPGGRLSADQWIVYDEASRKYGHNSIRFTTRQTIQFHWIAKGDLKASMKEIDRALFTASGGCGDIVRNVMQASNPLGCPLLAQLDPLADELSNRFKAKSNAYNEIWLDGQKVSPEKESEPIFGETYMPRKFKICVTIAGDNSPDLFSHDLGFAATIDEERQLIDGFHVYVGGGHGRSHNAPETFPLHAQYLGWVAKEHYIKVADSVITTQRDYGDRVTRKHARLKYLIHDRGIEWFREEVEKRMSMLFEQREPPTWTFPNYIGYHQRKDGTWALGIHILSGRVVDHPGCLLKSAIRKVVENYKPDLHITAEQDLIMMGIKEEDKNAVLKIFDEHYVDISSPSKLYDRALSCVAMPTCSLAITESERYLPSLLFEMDKLLKKHELEERAPIFRITGCPNGCCRPYSAELSLVGEAPGKGLPPSPGCYQIWGGGSEDGSRLGFLIAEMVPAIDLMVIFDQLFDSWKSDGKPGERLGDFLCSCSKDKLSKLMTVSA